MNASPVDIEGLSGTLVEPAGQGPFPVLLIISGSGPTDRDCNAPVMNLRTDAYRLLAEALAGLGVASFRYDKRGIGGSRALLQAESALTLQLFADDAARCVAWLERDGRFSRVAVCGHSEGSLIASILPEWRSERLISLCGPGFSIATTLRRQLLANLSGPLLAQALAVLEALDQGAPVPTVPDALASVFRDSVIPFLRSFWSLDPAERLARRKGALLVIGGGRDVQITQADFERLNTASPRAEKAWFPDMGHVLKDAGGLPTFLTYVDPTLPLSDGLAERIALFARA
jgi:pimeloyl-ACP methyl ester carboxylesterase